MFKKMWRFFIDLNTMSHLYDFRFVICDRWKSLPTKGSSMNDIRQMNGKWYDIKLKSVIDCCTCITTQHSYLFRQFASDSSQIG